MSELRDQITDYWCGDERLGTAAAAEIERMVRTKIADEIDAEPRDPSSEYERGLNVAASIARRDS